MFWDPGSLFKKFFWASEPWDEPVGWKLKMSFLFSMYIFQEKKGYNIHEIIKPGYFSPKCSKAEKRIWMLDDSLF